MILSMYQLIAIDLDGTLLNSYGEVSRENKIAIQKAKQKGIEVVLTSGRMSSSVAEIAREIEADNYMIAGNGAILYDLKHKETLYDECISKEKALDIIRICEENNIYYTLNTEKYILSKKLNYNLMYYYYENSKKREDKITNINLVENMETYVKENDIGKITKITISDESKVIFNGIMKKIHNLSGLNVLEVSHMSKKILQFGTEETEINYFYTEITKEKVNKWECIKRLAKHLNIEEKQIATIGDNLNDKEMIENAGIGIVMGKSALARQNPNHIVVSDNNANGVAEAIEQYILK